MSEHIVVKRVMSASADAVWARVVDIAAYPRFMKDVLGVRILSDGPDGRIAEWSIRLRGSILKWRERGQVDTASRIVKFEQIDGDLEVFEGHWSVADEGGVVIATLEARFTIGIPLLADMLAPVAVRTFRDNATAMLADLDTVSTPGPRTVSA